jgi:5'-nucleotidase
MATEPLILITNDDGIASPGLAAAVSALDGLGELLIAAPLVQQTSMSRSRSIKAGGDGRISKHVVKYGGKSWEGYGINTSPALTVEYALHELAERPVDLSISGINYGENVGSCVTVSGTIGAAIEAAERGIPSLAVSLELLEVEYHEYLSSVDFSTAAHFTRLFAERVLQTKLPFDVDVLKIEIPASATKDVEWVVTRQDRLSYYLPQVSKRKDLLSDEGQITHLPQRGEYTSKDMDTYALAKGLVAVTPLSIDLTSRVDLSELKRVLE